MVAPGGILGATTAKQECALNNSQQINQTSGKVEYGTDPKIVQAALMTMGRINLDPASAPWANEMLWKSGIAIDGYYSAETNGLERPWHHTPGQPSCVWLNHPFARGQNARWINKLLAEVKAGNVEQACCITFASTSEAWLQPLLRYPVCFLSPRTNYYLPDGTLLKGVTKGSMVTYIGDRVASFAYHFSGLGRVMLPINSDTEKG